MYNFLNDLKEINEFPSNIVIVYKVLRNLLVEFKTFVKVLQLKIDTSILTNLVSQLYMEEIAMNLCKE